MRKRAAVIRKREEGDRGRERGTQRDRPELAAAHAFTALDLCACLSARSLGQQFFGHGCTGAHVRLSRSLSRRLHRLALTGCIACRCRRLAYPAALQRFLARADSLCVEAFSCGTTGCASENGGDGEEPAGASKSKEPVVPTDVRGDNDAGQGTTWGDGFSWAVEDVHELSQCTLVLGADVVYDVRATDALVHLLADLLRSLPHTAVALVALERRINFHLPSLSARAVAADHFAAKLREPANQLCAERIPIDFEQRFAYERVAQLELWRIKASRTVEPVEASEDQCR
eukprot:3916572-Pleurochrysis_carterae.AAC.1